MAPPRSTRPLIAAALFQLRAISHQWFSPIENHRTSAMAASDPETFNAKIPHPGWGA